MFETRGFASGCGVPAVVCRVCFCVVVCGVCFWVVAGREVADFRCRARACLRVHMYDRMFSTVRLPTTSSTSLRRCLWGEEGWVVGGICPVAGLTGVLGTWLGRWSTGAATPAGPQLPLGGLCCGVLLLR